MTSGTVPAPSPEMDDDGLVRVLILRAFDSTEATVDVPRQQQPNAADLYARAAREALVRHPGPLGEALAGVLLMESRRRRQSGVRGVWGEHRTMIALALAVTTQEADSTVS